MNHFYKIWKKCTLLLFLVLMVTISLHGQTREGVVRIKLSEAKATYLQNSKVAKSNLGYVRTGDVALDAALTACRASNLQRVFRPAGKFEEKHRKHGLHLWYEVKFDKSTKVSTAVSAFSKLADVSISEPVYEKEIIGFNPMSLKKKMRELSDEPDDPLYADQWHYNNTGQTGGTAGADISLPQAWSIETGNSDVIVAVTDGGIDVAHEDLAANMWVNTGEVPGNGIDDDGNGYVDDVNGYGFGDDSGTIPADTHGSHVGGTVAAVTNNGVGVAGVAGGDGSGDGVRLMSCAAFGQSGTGGFAETYIYGADMGAVISQNSWGYTSPGVFEQAVLDAIDYFIAEAGFDELGNPVGPMQGGIVIFAAGNDGTDNEWYPGIYEPVLAVGGTDHNDDEYVFSNRGDWVDVAAPAVNVLSTLPNNQYGTLTGTSMACPHVSGLAGLIISQGNITPAQLRARIEQTTDPLPGLEFLGSGRINAFAALQQDDGVPPAAITDLSVSDKDLESVTLSWTAPADAGNGSATEYDIRFSTDPIDEDNFNAATPVIGVPNASVAGTPETFTISGLTAATTYYFAIKSADFFGNVSDISNVVNETTDEPPVASVSPSSMTSTLTTGELETQNLTISNSGNGPLSFDLSFGGTTFTPAGSSKSVKEVKPHSKLLTSTKAYVNNSAQTLSGDQYATGFESFSLGDLDGQDGWSADFQDWNISDDNPQEGSQHVRGVSETLPSGSTYSLVFSPDVGIGTEEYSSTTAKLSVNNSGTSWQFIPQSPSAELVVTRVSFDADGGISVYDGEVEDYVSLPTDVPSGYFDIKLIVHRTTFDMNLYIDNELVYVGKAATGDIEQIVLLSPMEEEGNEFLMDDLSIYDGEIDTYSFLSADITSGTVAGGEQQDIAITFDAAGLFGGTYENEITVETNDPANSTFTVPATLNVTGTGKPVISVDPTSITFDDTFVGGTDSDTVTISNEGTEILNVTDITTTGDFSVVGETSFTLLPFESEEVVVQFTPSTLGALSGTLDIANNDTDNPTLSVPLSGNGVEAPSITVSPASFSEELERGNSVTKVMTVTNAGVAPLEFAIETNAVEQEASTSVEVNIPSGKGSVKAASQTTKQKLSGAYAGAQLMADVKLSASELNVLVLSPDDDVTDVENALASFPDLNVTTYPKADLPGIVLSDLTPYDVVMTTNNTQWEASGSVDPALVGDLLADYIDQGGKVIANSFAYDYDAWALAGRFITDGYGPFTVTSTDFSGSTSMGTVHAPDHPIMDGVSSIDNSYLWQDPGLASGATLLADWADGNHFAAANDNVVALNILPSDGNGVPGWTGDLAVMYHNAILWLSGSGFVSTDIESGVLTEGESVDVNVTISAENLESGFYEATIDITSNDPVNSLVQVPVELNVLGPAVSTDPESMEVTVLQGLSESRTLTLSNNGSADAEYVLDVINGTPDTGISAVVNTDPARSSAFAGNAIDYAGAVNKSSAGQNVAGDDVYSTGFENFSEGNIDGQQGWTGQFGNWRVESFDPKSGSKHFQGLSDGLGQSVAYTPQLNLTSEAVTTAAMDVYLESGASWWISTESSSAINARVIFDQDGNVVMVSDDGAGGAQLDTLAFSVPSDYFNVAFEVDQTSGNFKFFINSIEVFEGKAFSTDLEYVVVLSQMETAGPVFNMDNLSVYEGRYVPEFLTLSETEGTIPAGGSVEIDVNFDGANVAYGTYFRDIQVFVNGASEADIVVPTTFNVTGAAAVEVTPQVLEQTVNYQEFETREFFVKNTGGQQIDFSTSVIGADLSAQNMQFGQSAYTHKKAGAKYEKYKAYVEKQPMTAGVTQLMVGETLFEEDFEGSTFPPSGWSVVDNEGSGLEWNTLDVHGLENWSGSGGAAAVNSDANQGVEFDTELITPAIDISDRTGVAVQYNVNYINFIGSDFLDLDVSTDGGSTWTNVLSWNESHGSFFAAPGESVTVELDDYVSGASSMKLRWRYYDPNSGDWDYYAQIDDIEVMADANAWLVVDPAAGSVPVGQSLPVNVTFDASKVDPDEYHAGILVSSNAANTPVASVFAMMNVLEPAEIEVSPTSFEQTLVTGFSDTQTLSITNNGESILRYNLGGFAKDAEVVSVTSKPANRITGETRDEFYNGKLFTGKEAVKVTNMSRQAIAPLYGTDFESFDPGDIDGQNGWVGQFGNWTVESENADSGNQHFRGLSDGLGQSVAITPNVGIGSEATSSFTTDVSVDGTGVTWQLIPQSSTAELVVSRLQINPDGSLDALVDDGAGNPVFETVVESVPSGYFNLKMESERATGLFDIYIDKELVYSGQGFAGDIEEVVVLSLMESAGPILDLDDLNIWDGPAPIPFLSTNPEFGNIASGETVEIEVTFDATYLEKGIYTDEIIVFNNDPDNSEVVVPVTLEVINPPALEVTPESIESYVYSGTTKDHTVTITNTGEANLRFGFAGYGDAPTPGEFSANHTPLTEAQIAKKLEDEQGSKPQSHAKPVTFMEGEELLFEGFEGTAFPPAGWTMVDNAGNGVVWEATSDNYSGGKGNAAIADSDAAGTVEYDTELISPEIDVDKKEGVVVQYYANYQNLLNEDFLDLDISTDGGATWTNVISWNEDHGSLRSVPGEFVSVELDEYLVGASSMKLRWHYYNPNTGDWDWYAQIDEVEVLYEGYQWLTLDPGQGVVEGGESLDVTVTFDATQVEPGTYNKELVLLTNVPDEPEKTLDMTMHAVIVEPLEFATVCSDNPDEERRWMVDNPNAFDVDAFWFIVGSSVGDSITVAPGVNYFTSPTQTDRPNMVKVKWLDHTGATNEAVSESSGLPCLVEDLNLTSMCSNNPDLFRRWRVRNPNPFRVVVDWKVVGTSQSGIIYAAGDSDTFFYTEAISGPNTTIIKWLDENGVEQEKVKASSGEICDIDNSCQGGEIIAFNQGSKKSGGKVSAKRSKADKALGIPEENDNYNFVSLGFGGSIEIELNSIVADQPGNDFMVIETSFNDLNRSCSDYEETADVYVSANGEDYYFVGATCRDGEFDIAESGLMEIQYVRIVDTSDPANFGGSADGYDVDGVFCINAHYSAAQSYSFGTPNQVPDEDAEDIIAFPNPFNEQIAIKTKVENEGRYIIRVHDMYGSLIVEKVVNATFGQIDARIDAVNISSGTYMVSVISEDETYRDTHVLIKN